MSLYITAVHYLVTYKAYFEIRHHDRKY